jgi:hypothetical protein
MAFMKGEQGSTLIEAAELSDAGGGGGVRLIGVAKGIPPPHPLAPCRQGMHTNMR